MLITSSNNLLARITWLQMASATTLNVDTSTFTKVPLSVVIKDNVSGFPAIATPNSILVPKWAKEIKVMGHLSFLPQTAVGAVNGVARIHLFRDDGPTTQDAFYHNITYFRANPASVESFEVSLLATTPWIPVRNAFGQEEWQLYAWQSTGQTAVLGGGKDTWMSCEFR